MTIGFKEQVIVTIEVWPTCMHNKDPTIIILILNDNLKTILRQVVSILMIIKPKLSSTSSVHFTFPIKLLLVIFLGINKKKYFAKSGLNC